MSQTYEDFAAENYAVLHDGEQDYGIVRIDRYGTWFLPKDEVLEECSEEQIRAAIALTFDPPHFVDCGHGQRVMADIRADLARFLPASA